MKQVHVAVGVILVDGKVLLAKRADHQHQGGLWEFPGGKVESGESVESALSRELLEEIGITIDGCEPLIDIAHDYGDKRVLLDTHVVRSFSGTPEGCEGQPVEWVPVSELAQIEFPAANVAIVDAVLALAE